MGRRGRWLSAVVSILLQSVRLAWGVRVGWQAMRGGLGLAWVEGRGGEGRGGVAEQGGDSRVGGGRGAVGGEEGGLP